MSMPTPEEFARLWEECVDEHDGGAIHDDPKYLRGLIEYIATRDAQVRADERAKMLAALRREQRLHGGAIGESPAHTEEQAARDYGAAVAIKRCIEIIAKADGMNRGVR